MESRNSVVLNPVLNPTDKEGLWESQGHIESSYCLPKRPEPFKYHGLVAFRPDGTPAETGELSDFRVDAHAVHDIPTDLFLLDRKMASATFAAPAPMLDYQDDTLDPIQDIFQQFEQANSSDSYSSSHSHSGASDNGLDTSFDGDLMMMYLNANNMGAPGAGAGAGQDQAGPSSGNVNLGQQAMETFNPASSLGFDPYGQPTRASPLSNASSPGYGGGPGSHHSVPTSHSTPNPSFDAHSGISPASSNHSTGLDFDVSAAATAHALFPYAPYPDPASFRAPASISAKPLAQQQQQQQQLLLQQQQQQQRASPNSGYNNVFTPPQLSNSLSPPSSAWSADGNFQQQQQQSGQSFIPNEALARMIAQAQQQGQAQALANQQENQRMTAHHAQAQAMAQAAFNASYMASLNISQRKPSMSSPPQQQAMYQDPTSGLFSSTSSQPTHQLPAPEASASAEKKKRKIAPAGASSTPARGAAGKAGGPVRSHKAQGLRKPSPPAATGQPMAISDDAASFSFALKPTGMPFSQRSPVDLIANAGLPNGQDTKKVYREELSEKIPINRAGAPSLKVQPPAPPLSKRPVDKKQDKPSKKGEKRKKGDKGHNAVERRYRNNINNAIATLRDIVPALRHLKPLPSMPASRRRASQFTLSTAAQAPTPAGLIDGIPAAKTLSKGTILSKAIEYIQYLQGAREDAAEDIEIFKSVVNEMVAGGATLIEKFEERRAVRELEREKNREAMRREQAILDDEDESDEDEDEDTTAPVKEEVVSDHDDARYHQEAHFAQQQQQQQQQQQMRQSSLDGLAQLRHHTGANGIYGFQPDAFSHGSSVSPNNPFPPSPVSSNDDHISPRGGHLYHQGAAPPRMMLAAFMGVSFAGGLGYDWIGSAESAGAAVGARAWAGRLVRRAGAEASSAPSGVISSEVVHPALLSGLVFLGIATVLASAVFLLFPLIRPIDAEAVEQGERSRSAYRQRRRAAALASLAKLNEAASIAKTYGSASHASLMARKELLKLVGAPTYGLIPALAKEALATALRNVTTIRVGTFSTWAEDDRVEAASAWVRIAEIEATIGADDINVLARCYTFLRLFNLSRSSHWPMTHASTSRPAVNAILAMHLVSLGQPLSAHALWNKAAKVDDGQRKKSDVALDPWVEIAISTDFEEARSILAATKECNDRPAPSDTVPLLRISEARCEAALRETWAKIFVAVVQTTCPPASPISPLSSFSTIVDQPLLEDTIAHIIASTSEGSTVHCLAKITRALCAYYTVGSVEARGLARELALEARAGGPISRLACAEPFFSLLFNDDRMSSHTADDVAQDPTHEIDVLACATLGWLTVRRQSSSSRSPPSSPGSTPVASDPVTPKADPKLHTLTLANRRLLGSKIFADADLVSFCAVGDRQLDSVDLDLETAQEACVDALTSIMRRAAGLKGGDDSGVELDESE
ncbi:hypothetical protein RQP46_001237 [Phenoliferia psychrophenolica]